MAALPDRYNEEYASFTPLEYLKKIKNIDILQIVVKNFHQVKYLYSITMNINVVVMSEK
jgi:hypothetical protein